MKLGNSEEGFLARERAILAESTATLDADTQSRLTQRHRLAVAAVDRILATSFLFTIH